MNKTTVLLTRLLRSNHNRKLLYSILTDTNTSNTDTNQINTSKTEATSQQTSASAEAWQQPVLLGKNENGMAFHSVSLHSSYYFFLNCCPVIDFSTVEG